MRPVSQSRPAYGSDFKAITRRTIASVSAAAQPNHLRGLRVGVMIEGGLAHTSAHPIRAAPLQEPAFGSVLPGIDRSLFHGAGLQLLTGLVFCRACEGRLDD